MTRPISLLEIPQDIYTTLFNYRNQVVKLSVGAGPDGEDLYWLKLTSDQGGWSVSNKIQNSDYVKIGACGNYVNPVPVLREYLITLRSNEWIIYKAIEELANRVQKSYCGDNPDPITLLDYQTPEWSDLDQGYTNRKGFISPASLTNYTGNYSSCDGLRSTEESNRVKFTFTELETRFN